MKTIYNFLAASVLILGMCTAQVSAEERQKDTNQTAAEFEVQMLDKKIAAIQSQIDELEKKGRNSLSRDEKIKLMYLKKQLLQTMRAKTAQQKKIIAEEKRKQKAIEKTNEKIDSILGSLSSKEKMDKK
jgi:L-lactate utilization protein LutC